MASKKTTTPKPATAATNERKIGEAFQLYAYAAIADIEKDLGEYGVTILHALAQNYDNLIAENKATGLKTRFLMADNAKQFLRLWIQASVKELVDAAIGDMKTIENVLDELSSYKEYSVCYALINNATRVNGATLTSAKYDNDWLFTYIDNLLSVSYPANRSIRAIVVENMILGLKHFAMQFGTLAYYAKCGLCAEMLVAMMINKGVNAESLREIKAGIVVKVVKKKVKADGSSTADAKPVADEPVNIAADIADVIDSTCDNITGDNIEDI